jgi:nitrate/TMAO reductase-like tetraheme cytochrome c subunit
MVEMHKPFGVKDCSVCHQPSDTQMKEQGEGGKDKKMELARQRKKDEKVCKDCHIVKDNHSNQINRSTQ